jgi:glutamate--LysW ligase ArgX
MASRFVIEIAYDVPRLEEKLLAKAASMNNLSVKLTNVRQTPLTLERPFVDVTLVRCVSMYGAVHAAALREAVDIKAINGSMAILYSGDKILTVSRLKAAGLLIPRVAVGLDAEAAEKALEKVGLPAVDKPPIGSWGRLVALLKDH